MALITNLNSNSTALITDKLGVSYEIPVSGSVTITNDRLIPPNFSQGVANGWISVTGWNDPNGTVGGLVPLTNVSYPRGVFSNLSIGENDLYTAPTGRRAVVMGVGAYNTAGSSNVLTLQVKKTSTYFMLSTATTLATITTNLGVLPVPYILEPGESLSALCTVAGTNVSAVIMEYDSTVPFFSKSKSTFTVGVNAIYTCPINRAASIGHQHLNRALQINGSGTSATISYTNGTGSGTNVSAHLVPTGVTAGTLTQLTTTAAVTTGNLAALYTAGSMLMTGDSVSIATDVATAGQYAWANIWEIGT